MALSIGELAARAGVNIRTIRAYEDNGLLEVPPRTPGGQRRYAEEEVERLIFIKWARALGFDDDEIKELLDLAGDCTRDGKDRSELVRRFIDRDRIEQQALAVYRSRIAAHRSE